MTRVGVIKYLKCRKHLLYILDIFFWIEMKRLSWKVIFMMIFNDGK